MSSQSPTKADAAPAAKPRGETQANQSVGKAVKILDYFRTNPEGRLSDLAEHAGLGPSTALRLILSLERCGALVRDPDTRGYSIGPWILELAACTVRHHPYTGYVHQVLLELRDETGETGSYWLVDGHERLCIDRVLSRHELSSTIEIGDRLPLHAGAAGRALVAFLDQSQQADVLGALRKDGVDVDALAASLDQVRTDGVAISVEEREKGLASVAVPVLDQRDALVGVLSLSAPVSRFSAARRRSVVGVLKEAAARLATHKILDG